MSRVISPIGLGNPSHRLAHGCRVIVTLELVSALPHFTKLWRTITTSFSSLSRDQSKIVVRYLIKKLKCLGQIFERNLFVMLLKQLKTQQNEIP